MLATTKDGLVISEDNGVTWTNASDSKTNSSLHDIYTDPLHNSRAFDYISGSLYMSNDYGANWKRLNFSLGDENNVVRELSYITTHPSNEQYLMVEVYSCQSFDFSSQELNETSEFEPESGPICSSYSFLSSDGGDTFLKIRAPDNTQLDGDVTNLYCAFGRADKYSQLGDESDVFCVSYSYSGNLGSDTNIVTTFFKTRDFGETVQEIDQFQGQKVANFQVARDYVLVTTFKEGAENSVSGHVWYSGDGSSFKEAQLPGGTQAFLAFASEETSGRQFISSIKFEKGDDKPCGFGLLMSDSTGLGFSELDLFSTNITGNYFFQAIKGLEGTIHAYFYSRERSGITRPVSKISLDNGKTWRGLQLEEPETKVGCEDRDEDGATCLPDNTIIDSWSLGPESESAASSGILVARGSTSYDVNTTVPFQESFISRNGGASWSKAFDFVVRAAFADRGNVIFAVPPNRKRGSSETLKAYYSLDRGYTWSEYKLEETLDPNIALGTYFVSNNLTFTVFVSAESFYDEDLEEDVFDSDDGDRYTTVYVFDFSEAFGGKTCTESDFEYWYQSEGKCVNGARYKYRRRKADAQCLVNEPFAASEKIEEPCDCTQEDYECAPMFVRDKNGTCVPDESLLKASGACGGAAETAELVPMRLELGNKCVNPLEIEPVQVACGGTDAGDNGSMGQNKDFFEAEF